MIARRVISKAETISRVAIEMVANGGALSAWKTIGKKAPQNKINTNNHIPSRSTPLHTKTDTDTAPTDAAIK